MNSRENLPMMLSANDIQTMGFTRTMAYNILNREDVPVVKIGSRKFIQRDKFFDWLDSRAYSVILCLSLFKTSSISKSIFNAH